MVLCYRCHRYTSGQSFYCLAASLGASNRLLCVNYTAESAFPGVVSFASSNYSKELDVGIHCSPTNGLRIAEEGNMKACLREGDNGGSGASERFEVSINGWCYTDGVSTTNTLDKS